MGNCLAGRLLSITVMYYWKMEMHSEKCIVQWSCHWANIIECTYRNLDSMVYYTPRLVWYNLLLLGYWSGQHVTILHTGGNCNTMLSTCVQKMCSKIWLKDKNAAPCRAVPMNGVCRTAICSGWVSKWVGDITTYCCRLYKLYSWATLHLLKIQ
jgi:hypothetical protein